MKRVLTLILSFSMLISLLSTSAAAATIDSYNVAENEIIGEEYLISEDLLPNGKLSKITAYNFPNGSVVYTYYEDNLKIRDYTVVPGSGYYDVQEYAVSSESTNNHTIAQRPVSKHTVYVGTATNIDTSKASASGYEYWGTVSYYNATMDKTYTIRCTIKEDLNTYMSFSPAVYYSYKA